MPEKHPQPDATAAGPHIPNPLAHVVPDREALQEALRIAAASLLDLEAVQGLAPDGRGPASYSTCSEYDPTSEALIERTGHVSSDYAIGAHQICTTKSIDDTIGRILPLYTRGVTNVAEVTAGIMACVARIPITMTDTTAGLHISALAGVLTAAAAADRMGYTLDLQGLWELASALIADPRPTKALVHRVDAALKESTPHAHLIFLTPLAYVPGSTEQREVVRTADLVRRALKHLNITVDCPGERLGPDSVPHWDGRHMFDAERRRIHDAGAVVIASGGYPSWGLGQALSWSETNTAAVAVFATNPSRVLSSDSQFNTPIMPWHSPEDTAQWVIDWATRNRAMMLRHAGDIIDVKIAWTRQILIRPDLLEIRAVDLAPGRQDAILRDPEEAASMTLAELRLLRRTDPTVADLIADTVTGRPHSLAGGNNAMTTESTHTNFESIVQRQQVTATERELMWGIAMNRHAVIAHQRVHIPEREWLDILAAVRGISRGA